jgi:hypothetical protein
MVALAKAEPIREPKMMHKELLPWLEHRAGIRQLEEMRPKYVKKALDLNRSAPSLVASYGKRDIWGFVGFVDLVGFSQRVRGLSNEQISNYLLPFLQRLVDLVNGRYALVDKTIGDEVMFLMPDMEEDGGPPAVLLMGQLFGGIHDLQKELGCEYPLRIGLAYGSLYIDQIRGQEYSEFTCFGETVQLAKRLLSLKQLEAVRDIAGAFGVLCREQDALDYFPGILSIIAGFASRMTHEVLGDITELKGVSLARCALLIAKE